MTLTSYILIQQLFEAARAVLAGRAIPETMRVPLEELEQMIAFREGSVGQRVIGSAQDIYAGDPCDIDIDPETVVYHNGHDGYWVMGWCHVADCEVTDAPADTATETLPECVIGTTLKHVPESGPWRTPSNTSPSGIFTPTTTSLVSE